MDDEGEKDKRINPEGTTSNRSCRKRKNGSDVII